MTFFYDTAPKKDEAIRTEITRDTPFRSIKADAVRPVIRRKREEESKENKSKHVGETFIGRIGIRQ